MQGGVSLQRFSAPSAIPDLVARLIQCPRDVDAENEFFHRFDVWIHRMVLITLRKRLGRRAAVDASDLVQDLYKRLFENDGRALRNFRGTSESEFKWYLARIGDRLACDQRRHAARHLPLGSEEAADAPSHRPSNGSLITPPDQEDRLRRCELREQIANSLRGFGQTAESRRDRLVFILRYHDGYSAREVAARLQLTPEHVHTIVHRVRKRILTDLAARLGARGPLLNGAAAGKG